MWKPPPTGSDISPRGRRTGSTVAAGRRGAGHLCAGELWDARIAQGLLVLVPPTSAVEVLGRVSAGKGNIWRDFTQELHNLGHVVWGNRNTEVWVAAVPWLNGTVSQCKWQTFLQWPGLAGFGLEQRVSGDHLKGLKAARKKLKALSWLSCFGLRCFFLLLLFYLFNYLFACLLSEPDMKTFCFPGKASKKKSEIFLWQKLQTFYFLKLLGMQQSVQVFHTFTFCLLLKGCGETLPRQP